MAVVLYKVGTTHTVRGIRCEQGIFDEHSYLHNLDNGWFYSPEECHIPEETLAEKNQRLINEEANKNKGTEDSTEEDIRLRAKDAGIRNWHNKGIDRLKEELNAVGGLINKVTAEG